MIYSRNNLYNNKIIRSGFSLMELIIVIVIIGTLIGAAISLNSAKESGKIQAGQEVVNNLINLVHAHAVNTSNNDMSNITITTLKASGVLPSSFTPAKANPWGGDLTIAVASGNNNNFTITMTNVPAASCQALKKRFSNLAIVEPTCDNEKGPGPFAATF